MAVGALTRLTCAHGLRQPITWISTGLGLVLLLLCMVFGMFNFMDEDRMRLLITAGVAVNLFNGLFLAVMLASSSVHDELASRTALTLFAKPMPRPAFLIGKALGCWLTILPPSIVISLAHLGIIALINAKGFDFYDTGGHHHHHHDADTEGTVAWLPWLRICCAHIMTLLNAGVITALAASLALKLSLVPNIVVCFACFVLAHTMSGLGMGTDVSAVIPALSLFNIDQALQFHDLPLTGSYFTLSLLYAVLYAAGALCIGLALFERQDIP